MTRNNLKTLLSTVSIGTMCSEERYHKKEEGKKKKKIYIFSFGLLRHHNRLEAVLMHCEGGETVVGGEI